MIATFKSLYQGPKYEIQGIYDNKENPKAMMKLACFTSPV